jgi:hypothetical protein
MYSQYGLHVALILKIASNCKLPCYMRINLGFLTVQFTCGCVHFNVYNAVICDIAGRHIHVP